MPESFVEHVGFGCVALTSECTRGQALRLLEAAYEAGIRYFDTAPGYGAGYSEKILGDFLRKRRDGVCVATKIGPGAPTSRLPSSLALPFNRLRRCLRGCPTPPQRNPAPPPLAHRTITRKQVQASVSQSLRSLRTGRIDVLLLHEALPSFLEADAFDYLAALRERGAVGTLGVAAHGANYLSLTGADLEGWDVLQYEHGPDWPRHALIREAFPGKRHVLHSCLGAVAPGVSAGAVLAAAARSAPGARVLFSSRRIGHIRANIEEGGVAWRAAG